MYKDTRWINKHSPFLWRDKNIKFSMINKFNISFWQDLAWEIVMMEGDMRIVVEGVPLKDGEDWEAYANTNDNVVIEFTENNTEKRNM